MTHARRYIAGRLRALTRHRRAPRVVIIGAGFGGLAAAVALRRKGIDDLLIVERADGVGGTWRQNIYPGAACDIQSHLYSFSFAPNRAWTRTYAYQPEILAYLESVADEFDLRRHLMLGTTVHTARWNTDDGHWEIELSTDGANRMLVADVVVSAVGLFGAVRYPDIDGLGDFAGEVMHTARWDPSIDLTGKRVAVIGTGASGVQVVPEIADTAGELTVFQRTPPWMVPKEDRAFSAEELARFRRQPWATLPRTLAVVEAATRQHRADPRSPATGRGPRTVRRTFSAEHVADEELRDALTPRYPFRCKRVLLGDKYYKALQRPHVDLVTDPIEPRHRHLDRHGVRRTHIEVDVIVLATGFETTRYLSGLDVVGVGGATAARPVGCGPAAYLGVAVSGFPNFFMLYGPNTNQGANSIIYILEAGARLVASAVGRLARRGGYVDVRPEAEQPVQRRRSPRSWSRRYGRSATATTDHRPGGIVTQWPHSELDYASATWRLRARDWVHAGS